ncbi:hypothetical protein CKY28_06815 [Sphingomonas lenta]|uniref:RES domain-containing protein n=1 Tax=Sphingomonas lenta TaxID=1141887 RepID=A0A2A2SIG9_9SPHN|nr:hypothetical protein CKY28_06815 [Sphingomonas lenta]
MWTPSALASEFQAYRERVWRVVEAQHRISTNRLASSLEDQRILEELADAVKPELPRDARHLHYLLASPFRYGHRSASRFRRADERPGIFYSSEHEATAIAETAYWRLRFLSRSPGLTPPRTVTEHSSFSVALRLDRLVDLTRPPLNRDADAWVSDDYAPCQALAASARMAQAQAIRSFSARDPAGRCNVALLDPAGFADRAPRTGKTWHLRIEGSPLIALAAFPSDLQARFTAEQFGLTIG